MAQKNALIVAGCAFGLCANACATFAQPPRYASRILHGSAIHFASQAGEIDGAVHALSGSPIAAAAVRVLNADGSVQATLSADAAGHFRIQLPPGTYAVVVSQPGFLSLRIGNIAVSPGHSVPLNFSLANMPPSGVSGAILHPYPIPPKGVPQLGPMVQEHTPDQKPVTPPQTEQVLLLHPTQAPVDSVAVTAPPPAQENAGDATAAAQAKATVDQEQQQQKEVQDFVNSLPKGLISYLVPLQMRLNQPVTVSVKIFGAQAPASLAAGSGGTSPTPISTSNYMQVYLSEEDNPGAFAIDPGGDQNPRWVSSTSETDWNWTVTPKTTGTAKLRFQTLVMFPDQAGKLPATYDVKDETVTVTTPTMGEYLHSAWDTFLTNPAVWFEYILPGGTGFVILSWLVSRSRNRKKKGTA